MLDIKDVIAVVRNDKYRSSIETDSGKFARLVDMGEVEGNPDLIVLCFDEHQFALLYAADIERIEENSDILHWNREFNIFCGEDDDVPEYTIKCKMIRS